MIWLSAHNGASFIELVLPPDETPQDTRYKCLAHRWVPHKSTRKAPQPKMQPFFGMASRNPCQSFSASNAWDQRGHAGGLLRNRWGAGRQIWPRPPGGGPRRSYPRERVAPRISYAARAGEDKWHVCLAPQRPCQQRFCRSPFFLSLYLTYCNRLWSPQPAVWGCSSVVERLGAQYPRQIRIHEVIHVCELPRGSIPFSSILFCWALFVPLLLGTTCVAQQGASVGQRAPLDPGASAPCTMRAQPPAAAGAASELAGTGTTGFTNRAVGFRFGRCVRAHEPLVGTSGR